MSELSIEVQTRAEMGKNANRRLRASGQIPAVVYGDDKDPVAIQVEQRKIDELLRNAEGGENSVFLLRVEGTKQSRHTMIREMQVDPIRGHTLHIDFQRINMAKKVHVTVPVELEGLATGVKVQGGILDFVTREVELECLPANIPPHLGVDVSGLDVGDHLEAGQIELPDGVEMLLDPSRVIASVHAPRIEEAEGEDEDEGLIEAAGAEPEVLKQKADE